LWATGGAASLALLAATFHGVDAGRVTALLEGLGWSAPLLLLPSSAALLLEARAWQLGLSSAGHRARLGALLGVRVASESIGTLLPLGTVWADAMKPSLLAARCSIPFPAGVAGVAIRKYLLVSSQAAYLAIAFALGHEALRAGFAHATGIPSLSFVALAAACALAVVGAGMAALLGRGSTLQRFVGWLSKSRFRCVARGGARLRDGAHRTDDAAAAFFGAPLHDRARALAACLAAWLLEATETWLVLAALGASVGFRGAVGVEALVVLSRHLLPLLPGGLGVQELGYTALFAGVGCDVDRALSLVVLKRAREAAWLAVGAVALSSGALVRGPSRAVA
jgi:uncharacterized protein (TIRG00374 family)